MLAFIYLLSIFAANKIIMNKLSDNLSHNLSNKTAALSQRLANLAALGEYMLDNTEARAGAVKLAELQNGWFSQSNSLLMIENIAKDWLNPTALADFVAPYAEGIEQLPTPPRLGLVLAGNLPLVGLHDIICGYLVGAEMQIKLSDKDKALMQWLLFFLSGLPSSAAHFQIVEQLKPPFDRVIATGSDNSALHFEQYFAKYPNIIRRNRNSVAMLTGEETDADIKKLGLDIFRYFGLGCRSVSKIYVPEGYDFVPLMRRLDLYKDIINHVKYCNNFDYNRSIYLINKVHHYINDCIMLLENAAPMSRIATLHYEFYTGTLDLSERLAASLPSLQVAVAGDKLRMDLLQYDSIAELPLLEFGQSQCPMLSDFADNTDTMQFLASGKTLA